MKSVILIAAALGLVGCATSTASLGRKAASLTFEGTEAAEVTAGCLVTELAGSNQLAKLAEGHWVVTRPNGYGVPVVRWDIFSIPSGNRVELRSSFGINTGEPKARACSKAPAV